MIEKKPFTQILEFLSDPRYQMYYEYLVEQNKLLNLTTITERDDVYRKHFYDSMVITQFLDFENKKLLDIGAGAGFPSIPILLYKPSLNLTIVDGLRKRIDFLERLTDKLEIKVDLIHGRAEELGIYEAYDIITARAVSKLNILLEMAMPLLKKNGYFVAYKSIHCEEELASAERAIKKLGGKLDSIIEYDVLDDLKHVYIIIKKVAKTPSIYPRHFSKIKKSPL